MIAYKWKKLNRVASSVHQRVVLVSVRRIYITTGTRLCRPCSIALLGFMEVGMSKPAARLRSRMKHDRHLHACDSQPAQPVNLAKERARACVLQDRMQSITNVEPVRSLASYTEPCVPQSSDLTASIKLLEDCYMAIETPKSSSKITNASERQDALSRKLMIVKLIGADAIVIKQALSVCRRIANAVGEDDAELGRLMGVQLEF